MWAMFTHQINFTLRCICTSQCFQDEDEIYKGWTYCFIWKHCSKSILSCALPVLDPRKHWACVCGHRRRESRGKGVGKGTSSHSLFLLSPWPTELPENSKYGPKMLEKSGLEVSTLPSWPFYLCRPPSKASSPLSHLHSPAGSSAWNFTNC